jgi:hypothetical protein
MDIHTLWSKALKQTEILRMRLQDLSSVDVTAVPYIFLAESALNRGDTVVRQGQVLIERPALWLPSLSPHFEGFEFEKDFNVSSDTMTTFFLVRGVQFPSMRYRHQVSSLDVTEQSLQRAADQFRRQLTMAEDVKTGLVLGPEDAWQFSILLLVGSLVIRSAPGDLRRMMDEWRKRQGGP